MSPYLSLSPYLSPRLTGGIARVIFVVHGRTMVLLHGFTKKTQKTPKHELELAIRRKKQLM
jgi:phage-related protein